MWRHITGVEQPANKFILDNNEKLERKRTYDQVKRKRKFKTSWQKNCNLNWLVHKSEIDRMPCSACIQYASSDLDKNGVYVTGSSNFKLESVISHETSEQHISVGKQSAKENSTVNSAAVKIVQSLNKNVFNRMTNLFRNVNALIKKETSIHRLYMDV
jgi:hypothetical protein